MNLREEWNSWHWLDLVWTSGRNCASCPCNLTVYKFTRGHTKLTEAHDDSSFSVLQRFKRGLWQQTYKWMLQCSVAIDVWNPILLSSFHMLYSCLLSILTLVICIMLGLDTIKLTWMVWFDSPILGWCFSCINFTDLTVILMLASYPMLTYENLCSEQFSVFLICCPTDIHWLSWFLKPALWNFLLLLFLLYQTTSLVKETRNRVRRIATPLEIM